MPALSPSLRDQLATVIGKEKGDDGARAAAEAGAKAALEALAVHLPAPHPHLDEKAAALRNRLRARARQLGDTRRSDRGHEIKHLVEQCAYEHWHRMLFARFLAENDLLIHPEYGTAVTLSECAELAPTEGARDAWDLAARYASRMLPQIFRSDDPVLEVRLPPEHVHELERLVGSLPVEVFTASDSLGWVYQFWQARRKKEVNDSEVKIGADELPAVTQLFTEPYMVQFLLQNTLGAWWIGAGRSLPMQMPYLRLLDNGKPAAGCFKSWPMHTRDLKVLDPCCGSGHFLVAAFEMLVPFRMKEEHLSAREACDAVLRDNLSGLEIDYRCTQIAAFALALAAWRYHGAGGWRPLPPLNIACSGLPVAAKESEWLALANGDARLRTGMERLYRLFQQGPTLGSLIDPRSFTGDLLEAGFAALEPLLARAAAREKESEEQHEMAVTARGLAKAAGILSSEFTLVATNVPYLTRAKQGECLQAVGDQLFPDAKGDLATMFLKRSLKLLDDAGTAALVIPQNWLFLTSYASLRKSILAEHSFAFLGRLGSRSFETIGGDVVNPALVVVHSAAPTLQTVFAGLDANDAPTPRDKAHVLRTQHVRIVNQEEQRQNPDARFTLSAASGMSLLSTYAEAFHGQGTFDTNRFTFCFWELPGLSNGSGWVPQQSTVDATRYYGGCSYALRWEHGEGALAQTMEAWRAAGYSSGKWRAGTSVWRKKGVMVNQMGDFPVSLYAGWSFDENAAVVIPRNEEHHTAIWAFLSSEEYRRSLKSIDQSIKVTCKTLVKVPFDLDRWKAKANTDFPRGLPEPRSTDPTQWLFDGDVATSEAPLHVAVARLVGFRWPCQKADVLDEFADDDGIVCIPPVRGERRATDRLLDLLSRAYGKDWHPHRAAELLAAERFEGRQLDEWLRNGFFEQHCRVFHHRPFVWHIWDGHRDGFSALVHYHRLDRKRLESLTYTYLGDWIATEDRANKTGKSGAGSRLAKARELQRKLEAIIEGEPPYDVFVRWKSIEKQPIGWEPDLNDGVRLNIRPFIEAGILRFKPNINWKRDRGKNPPGSPWGETRNNDIHLTIAEKRKVRGST